MDSGEEQNNRRAIGRVEEEEERSRSRGRTTDDNVTEGEGGMEKESGRDGEEVAEGRRRDPKTEEDVGLIFLD